MYFSTEIDSFEYIPLHNLTKNIKVAEAGPFNVENLILDVKSFIAGVFK